MIEMKRKTLLLLMLLALLTPGAMKAQWSGSGTADSPYLITSASDWNTLATNVSNGTTYSGSYFQLTADISVSTMIGTGEDSNNFRGTFDGNGHQITVSYGTSSSPLSTSPCAPFRYMLGGTIKNLKVAGNIYNNANFTASIVGFNKNTSATFYLENCISTVNIYCNGGGTHGGLVGVIKKGKAYLNGCVFAGKLNGGSSCSSGNAGLVGFADENNSHRAQVIAKDCVFAPSEQPTMNTSGGYTLIRHRDDGQSGNGPLHQIKNCYYTYAFGRTESSQTSSSYYLRQGQKLEYTISGGSDVTVTLNGGHYYNVSGITGFNTTSDKAILYNGQIYSGSGNSADLNLSYNGSGTLTGYTPSSGSFSSGSGITGDNDAYTLTMPAANVTISATTSTPSKPLRDSDNNYMTWAEFASNVSGGNTYSGKTITMLEDISGATAMVGTSSYKFAGTFDGNGHTLNVEITGNSSDKQGTAPFHYISTATIKNLVVTGTVSRTDDYHASGLVGFTTDSQSCIIQNCVVSTTVTFKELGGGIVGHGKKATTNIIGCIFNGVLRCGVYSSDHNRMVGGLVGWSDSDATINITNSLYAGTYNGTYHGGSSSIDFHPVAVCSGGNSVTANLNNCYYTCSEPSESDTDQINTVTNDGRKAYTIEGASGITVTNAGSATPYTTSGITGYGTWGGILYGGTLYGGQGKSVSLNLGGSDTGYEANAGTLTGTSNPYSLTMPAADVTISAKASGGDETYYELASTIESGAEYLIVWANQNTASASTTFYAMERNTKSSGYLDYGTPVFSGSGNARITDITPRASGHSISDFVWKATSSGSDYTFSVVDGNTTYYLEETSASDGNLYCNSSFDANKIKWAVVKSSDEYFNIHNTYWYSQYSSPGGRYYYLYYNSGFENYWSGSAPTQNGNYRMYLYKKIEPKPLHDSDNNYMTWDEFAGNVNGGTTYSGKTIYLDEDITVSGNTMAGSMNGEHSFGNAFSGTFDGQGHTITVSYNQTESGSNLYKYTAPFPYINNATIQNLTVSGSITNAATGSAGLVGYGHGTNYITNCVSAVTITGVNYGCNGGFMANNNMGTTVYFEGCAFTGTLAGNGMPCGGFIGWSEDGQYQTASYAHFTNCVVDPHINSTLSSDSKNFTRTRAGQNLYFTNCYYVTAINSDSSQGKQAYSITGGTDVTVTMNGTATPYDESGITVYASNSGMLYSSTVIAGNGETVSLTLSGSTTGEYEADHGTLSQSGNNWTLAMEANNTVISAVNCFRPTNLAASGNTITWSGNDASYIVEYGVTTTTTGTILSQGFEDGLGSWTFTSMNTANDIASGKAGCLTVAKRSGDFGFRFSSYSQKQSSETYDQYLVSPELTLAGTSELKFYCEKTNDVTENLYVGYSTTTNNLDAFIWSEDCQPSYNEWKECTQSLPSEVKYIAFHYYGEYKYYVYLDDISVTGPTIEWHQASAAATSPYTFTDSSLTPGATYPARVKSECGQVSNEVEFTMPNTFEVTVSANPSNGGTIDHTGGTWSGSTGTYQYGANAELTANPATGYTFTGWTIDGISAGTTNPITVTMDADHNVVANFGLIGYTITTSVNPENSGSVTGGGEYHYNETCTLTATPAEGYSFSKWSDNNTSNPRTFTVMGSGAYTAIFTPNNYTIGYENDGNGTCTGPASAIYGSTVEVTVNPATGYELATLTYNDGSDHTITPVSGVYSYSFTMPAHSVTVSATFSKINYNITYTNDGNGSCSGVATANYGDNVTVTVTPATGYALATLTYNGTPITPVGGVYSFTMPASAVTVHATFVAYVSVTYAVSPTGAGIVTYSPAGEDYDGGTASQEVSIGSGSGTQNVFPINGNSINGDPAYSVCEMLYKVGEIGMSGTIKKLSFFYNGATTLYGREIDLYLKQTDRENFKGIGWEKIVANDFCPSTVTVSATETSGVSQVTITLSGDGFEYDGTLNLLVAIYDHTGSTGPVNWYYTSTGTDNDSKTCTVFTSTEGIIPTALTQAQQGAASPNRPNIKIEIAAEGGNTVWYTSGATPTFTATANSGYYFLNWTEGNAVVSTDAAYTFTVTSNRNLTANFVSYKRFTTAGDWNTASNWTPAGVPDENIDVRIEANATISGLAKAKDIVGIADGCGITINNGGQLWHSNDVAVTITKHVEGYEDSSSNKDYILFSMPFSGVSNNSLVTTDSHYDWYHFSYNNMEGGELLEWVHETAATVPFMRGYIYANEADKDITASGVATQNATDYTPETPLAYSTSGSYRFNGWNLVGNPFVCNAYAFDANGTTGGELNFYKLNSTGDEFETASSSDAIAPMGALMVKASGENEKVRYSRTAPVSKSGILNMSVTKSNYRGTIDLARIRFGEGEGLPKFQLNPDHTKLYVPMEDNDYAVVYAEPVGEMPVSFKAEENGQYTLTFSAEEVGFSYLHLIDNLTGADVDLLETPYYTFSAKTTDYASRFKVVFATGSSTSSDTFAFYSNGMWVIANDGDAILQVVDVTGRVLSSDRISGATSKPIHAAPGVYMLRLINGDNVKVQKVVVR